MKLSQAGMRAVLFFWIFVGIVVGLVSLAIKTFSELAKGHYFWLLAWVFIISLGVYWVGDEELND